MTYRIAGFFRGENFSRIDLIQIFEGKNFTNHSTGTIVIIIIITREIMHVKFSLAGMAELYKVESIVQGKYGLLQLVQCYPVCKKGLIHTIVMLLASLHY